jgi:hypothetical protein
MVADEAAQYLAILDLPSGAAVLISSDHATPRTAREGIARTRVLFRSW